MVKIRSSEAKKIHVVPVLPPPVSQRARRLADFPAAGAKKGRYDLPERLQSASPVGFRTRLAMTEDEASEALELLAMGRPSAFLANAAPPTEQELFEESALGVLSARQSTNYRGQRTVVLGPEDSKKAAQALRALHGIEAPVLDHATHTHLVLSRPYRTPFTLLLTFIGHKPFVSLATVPLRAFRKGVFKTDDIPTVGYLQHLHLGILVDQMERATVIASGGTRMANVFMRPFCGEAARQNASAMKALEALAGLDAKARARGWTLAAVAQVGAVAPDEALAIDPSTLRTVGANMLAFRSERIMPGVNHEASAPAQYHAPQDIDVPEDFTVMAGRAAYNAFSHWTGVDREEAKELLLLERVDTSSDAGQARLTDVRAHLDKVADIVIGNLPKWVDLPLNRALSRNAARGKKAFALAGQRIYMGGLDRSMIQRAGLDWQHAVRAFGAASARGALVAELMGVVNLPEDCDLLAGICLMAGPVNQNDIGKEFFGERDLLADAFPDKNPTSLLFWTLKAKTVADPIGNEEQLVNAAHKGALVDLRPGPHEVVHIRMNDRLEAMRRDGDRVNAERAFGDRGNFVTAPCGRDVPGNRGEPWSTGPSARPLWT